MANSESMYGNEGPVAPWSPDDEYDVTDMGGVGPMAVSPPSGAPPLPPDDDDDDDDDDEPEQVAPMASKPVKVGVADSAQAAKAAAGSSEEEAGVSPPSSVPPASPAPEHDESSSSLSPSRRPRARSIDSLNSRSSSLHQRNSSHRSHRSNENLRDVATDVKLGTYAQSLLDTGPDVGVDMVHFQAKEQAPGEAEQYYEVPIALGAGGGDIPDAPAMQDMYFWARGRDLNLPPDARAPMWLHSLTLDREKCERLLTSFGATDGLFLVRERALTSPEHPTKFALSVCVHGHIEHLLIMWSGSRTYSMRRSRYLPEVLGAATLHELVATLSQVPHPGRLTMGIGLPYLALDARDMPGWYHPSATREETVKYLTDARDGSFMVRPTNPSQAAGSVVAYFLSVRHAGRIYHHVLAPKGVLWTLNSELIEGTNLQTAVEGLMAAPPVWFPHTLRAFVPRPPPFILVPAIEIEAEAPAPPPRPSLLTSPTSPTVPASLASLFDAQQPAPAKRRPPPLKVEPAPEPPPRPSRPLSEMPAGGGLWSPPPVLKQDPRKPGVSSPVNRRHNMVAPLAATSTLAPTPVSPAPSPLTPGARRHTSAAAPSAQQAAAAAAGAAAHKRDHGFGRAWSQPTDEEPPPPPPRPSQARTYDETPPGVLRGQDLRKGSNDYEDANTIFQKPNDELLTQGMALVNELDGAPPVLMSEAKARTISMGQTITLQPSGNSKLTKGQVFTFHRGPSGDAMLVPSLPGAANSDK